MAWIRGGYLRPPQTSREAARPVSEVITTRPVSDADADDLIALVGDSYAEYPGCILDLDDLDRDLLEPATAISRVAGRWWVVEDDGRIVGSIAAGDVDQDGDVELKRLYVASTHRRRGVAADLVAEVEAHGRRLDARRVVLWTDSRFTQAHRLYERLGYVETGERRDLDDLSNTTELEFVKPL
jgi:RimJ/RimL family protein N-acetyltransferase